MKPEIKYITSFPESDDDYGEAWYTSNENSFLILNCSSANIYYPEHWTPLSIKCAFEGKEYYKFGNVTYAVDNNNFLLLNEGSVYSSYINSKSLTESFTLNFSQKNINDLLVFRNNNERGLLDDPFLISKSGLRVFEKLYPHNFKTYSYINKIKSYGNNGESTSSQLLETLYSFLEELTDFNASIDCEIDHIHAKKRTTREELYKRLHIAKDYMQSCFDEDISLESLSKICHLNTYHLLREFKKFFQVTPHKYLTQIRLKEAHKLVTQTNLNITDMVTEVGFEDASSFSKLFKSYYGASPQRLRENAIK